MFVNIYRYTRCRYDNTRFQILTILTGTFGSVSHTFLSSSHLSGGSFFKRTFSKYLEHFSFLTKASDIMLPSLIAKFTIFLIVIKMRCYFFSFLICRARNTAS